MIQHLFTNHLQTLSIQTKVYDTQFKFGFAVLSTLGIKLSGHKNCQNYNENQKISLHLRAKFIDVPRGQRINN